VSVTVREKLGWLKVRHEPCVDVEKTKLNEADFK
jgi:hypothetical protein